MDTVHLYLRRGPGAALSVCRHAFQRGAGMQSLRETVPAGQRAAWLAAQCADPSVRAIYNCHASGVSKPDGCPVPWVDLPAGHPCEKL